ncbi:hypothetical protein LR48_Vigan07g199900 [Vigna angularis]|uniref:Aconitase/3-isopropylmalate dehydratase large subunit alpha/beta/alpha domain-containing protein n=1 Tax=Phaseolus angularis TaxID=3914 RepID=A0A0L9UZJ5_PHAAN|nr:hypothetical protein LR48_Vigan07g199900 [Vigna angularis]
MFGESGVGVFKVNLEYLGRVDFNNEGLLYPDSVVETDSHITMIDGLGVAGWGVRGIESDAVMLGQFDVRCRLPLFKTLVLIQDARPHSGRSSSFRTLVLTRTLVLAPRCLHLLRTFVHALLVHDARPFSSLPRSLRTDVLALLVRGARPRYLARGARPHYFSTFVVVSLCSRRSSSFRTLVLAPRCLHLLRTFVHALLVHDARPFSSLPRSLRTDVLALLVRGARPRYLARGARPHYLLPRSLGLPSLRTFVLSPLPPISSSLVHSPGPNSLGTIISTVVVLAKC